MLGCKESVSRSEVEVKWRHSSVPIQAETLFSIANVELLCYNDPRYMMYNVVLRNHLSTNSLLCYYGLLAMLHWARDTSHPHWFPCYPLATPSGLQLRYDSYLTLTRDLQWTPWSGATAILGHLSASTMPFSQSVTRRALGW